jgi:hypothetical protein
MARCIRCGLCSSLLLSAIYVGDVDVNFIHQQAYVETHDGRMWLLRIHRRLSTAFAIEEDPYWKAEFLRALIVILELREGRSVGRFR